MDSYEGGNIVLFKEYGSSVSSAKERSYVKPAEQLNIVVLKDDKLSNMAGMLTRIFLPQGYPDSVSKDYLAYQIWDTAQAFCSTITGTLATQEVLRGVGVGDKAATPLAATIIWVIRDGCGHLGRILFAYSHGSFLDSYSKKWRLYADTLNDAAMCIEIALPMFRGYTTFALCVSTFMKSIVGIAGSATRVAMTQHHALRGNIADVSAKDSAQETAVNFLASFTALFIIALFGNNLYLVLLMMVLHIVFNYLAVRAVCLRTFNEPRFLLVIDNYLKNEIIASPCEINRSEPIIFYQLGQNLLDLRLCGFQIKLGQSLAHMMRDTSEAFYLLKIKEIYADRRYMVYPDAIRKIMYVFLKEQASVNDVFCAYFHAVLLASITSLVSNHSMKNPSDSKPFAKMRNGINLGRWNRDAGQGQGSAYMPSFDLLRYVRDFATVEWPFLKIGLLRKGWDLSKHLIMVGEWRVYNDLVTTEIIQPENIQADYSTVQDDDNYSNAYFLSDNESSTIEPESDASSKKSN